MRLGVGGPVSRCHGVTGSPALESASETGQHHPDAVGESRGCREILGTAVTDTGQDFEMGL